MTTEQEFDLLRQTCSTALQQFIAEARKTELAMQQLTVPRRRCRRPSVYFPAQRRSRSTRKLHGGFDAAARVFAKALVHRSLILFMASPDREDVLQLCTAATSVSQSLERELLRFDGRLTRPRMKEFYDALYLPRLVALSHQAHHYVPSEDWQLLCQPLHPDLAGTQLRIVIETLYSLVMAL